MFFMKNRFLPLFFAGVFFAGTGASIAEEAAGEADVAAQHRPPTVGVVEAKFVPVPLRNELPGRITPVRTAQVRARVPGILLKQVFREGADVKKDELLFEIDPELFKANLARAEAEVARAKAVRLRADADLTRAELLKKRCEGLVGTKAVSQQDFDNAISAELQAKAEVQSAKANLLAAEAALKAADLDLRYTNVTAPIAGRIGRALVTEGALVGQGEATPLAVITQMDPVYVDFTQPANELTRYKNNAGAGADWSKVSVKLELGDGTIYDKPGKLMFSEITVDPSTGSVTLRAEFPNKDWRFWPGMYVRGIFEFDNNSKAVLVPHQAVMQTAVGYVVYVVGEGNKLEVRPVKTTDSRGTNWVVREGFKDGDKIVVDGAQRVMLQLKPGSVVTPVPANEKQK